MHRGMLGDYFHFVVLMFFICNGFLCVIVSMNYFLSHPMKIENFVRYFVLNFNFCFAEMFVVPDVKGKVHYEFIMFLEPNIYLS